MSINFFKMMKAVLILVFLSATTLDISNACFSKRRPKRTCCPDVYPGFCFPPNSLFTNDPECPSTFAPDFQLFTRKNRTTAIPITKSRIPSQFSNNRKTVFIVHGWRSSFSGNFVAIKDALLDEGDFNVIAVDWSEAVKLEKLFLSSAANTESIGALIGAMVNNLRHIAGSNQHFWCIGHSLGAHACGFTSATARPVLDRITGLDPARPSFGIDKGLTKDDATNVDVIHTDIYKFGSKYPRGDVDFYPNGGAWQPGCSIFRPIPKPDLREGKSTDYSTLSDDERIRLMESAMQERGSLDCSHEKAVIYMLNSIKYPNCYKVGRKCSHYLGLPPEGNCPPIPSNQKGVMGYNATNNYYDGVLYFKPKSVAPHCTNY